MNFVQRGFHINICRRVNLYLSIEIWLKCGERSKSWKNEVGLNEVGLNNVLIMTDNAGVVFKERGNKLI